VILTESEAQTTREEAVKSGALLREKGVGRILLVTGSHHMSRAQRLFERAGFEVLAAEQVFILILVGLTSVGAYVLGARVLNLSVRSLRKAVGRMLECFGISLVFLVINLTAGMSIILAARALTDGFVSLYVLALQGLTFLWWRDLSVP
jgi:hypothetical protein